MVPAAQNSQRDAGARRYRSPVTLVFIGLVGGLLTGISPCILPVLPVVFLGGASGTAPDAPRRSRARPLLIVLGLTLSFAVFTLFGTVVLSLLHLPADLIRWVGLALLVVIGLAMMIPPLERIIEKPFSWIPQRYVSPDRGGFVLGLALGTVFVPCAGPVLAAITVAGATGNLGPDTYALTIAFAIGTAIPLLVFALAGQQLTARIAAFRTRQRLIRTISGAVMIALAVALAFNVTDIIQRYIPNYTQNLANSVEGGVTSALAPNGEDQRLLHCQLEAEYGVIDGDDCGPAPEFAGIQQWLNTPNGAPLTVAGLKGKVVLVDFWAYSCINCQRELPHVEAWANAYGGSGFVAVGVHTPEYAFEHVPDNVAAGAARIGVTFPVAIDNDYGTWNAYANNSWPASYLIDASGEIRYVFDGEGNYGYDEQLIRQLLQAADPTATLPAATDVADTTPTNPDQSPETYLGSQRAQFYDDLAGHYSYTDGTQHFTLPDAVPLDAYALGGTWTVGDEAITAGPGATILLHFDASQVYLDVGGTGTLTVTVDGTTHTVAVSGTPNIYTVASGPQPVDSDLTITLSPGLEAYSFTFG